MRWDGHDEKRVWVVTRLLHGMSLYRREKLIPRERRRRFVCFTEHTRRHIDGAVYIFT